MQRIGEARIKAVQLRKDNPMMTLEAIGASVGVTKQRVYKIFQDEGIARRPKKTRKHFKLCRNCGILINTRLFCSDKCREEDLYTDLPCSTCGKLVKHRKYIILQKLKKQQYNFFCSRKCFHIKTRKDK